MMKELKTGNKMHPPKLTEQDKKDFEEQHRKFMEWYNTPEAQEKIRKSKERSK